MPLSNPIAVANIIALWSGTPDGSLFLRDDGILADPIPDYSGADNGDVMTLVAGTPAWAAPMPELPAPGTAGQVLTLFEVEGVGTVPVWETPAGGGYDKLTVSGANEGTFTFFDDTATVGVTKVNVQAGAGHVYGAALVELLSSVGGSLTSNYGLVALYGGEVQMNAHVYNDANGHEGFELRGGIGLALHADREILWSQAGAQYNTRDFGIKRAGTNAGKATNGGAGFSQWRCASIALGNIVAATTLGTVVGKAEVFVASTGASAGFVPVYDAIT